MKVDFSQAAQAAGQLESFKIQLGQAAEELDSIEQEVRTLSETEGVCGRIHQCREEMMLYGSVMGQMEECITEMIRICRETESRIQDAYMAERIIYPQQTVGMNQIRICPEFMEQIKITLRREEQV